MREETFGSHTKVNAKKKTVVHLIFSPSEDGGILYICLSKLYVTLK